MKEFIMKEGKNAKYEYSYRLQNFDIKTILEFDLPTTDAIRNIGLMPFSDDELFEYSHFTDPESVEYISRQYWIRDVCEFSGMNVYELDLLIRSYLKNIQNLENLIIKLQNPARLFDLNMRLTLLKNELNGLYSLKKEELEKEQKHRK